MIAETERLSLRRLALADHAALMRFFGDAEVMRFGDGPQSAELVRDWLRRALESYDRRDYGPWAVVEKTSGEVIGYCGLF